MGYRIPTLKSQYYLPKQEYLTLRHFCYQYPEWHDRRKALLLEGVRAVNCDGMPHGSNTMDPTESAGIKIAMLDRNIRAVEETAAEAGGELYKWLLKGVTDENATYAYLKQVMKIPCGKNLYYRRRQMFYWRLSQKMAFF